MKVKIEASDMKNGGFPLTWNQIKNSPGFYASDYGSRIIQIVNTEYFDAVSPFILWNNGELQNYGHNADRCPSVTESKFRRILGVVTINTQ